MSLFKRVINIVRSNLNSKSSSSFSADFSDNFDNYNYQSDFEEQNFSQESVQKNSANDLEREYYANLEVAYGASFDEIKASYKRLLKKYHPDKFYGDEKKLQIAQDVVKKLNIAYNYFEEKYNK